MSCHKHVAVRSNQLMGSSIQEALANPAALAQFANRPELMED